MGATARLVDLSNVKEGGSFNKARIPSGDYMAKIVKVEDAKAPDGINQYLFTIQIVGHSSTKLPYYCKLQDNQLWKLRNIFIAAGKTVPKQKVKVDPNQIVGKLIGVTVEDTEYKEKEQSEIAGVFPSAELGDQTAVSSSTDDDDEPDEDDADDDGSDLDTSTDDAEDEAEEEPEEAEEEAEEEDAEEADPYADLDRATLKTRIKALQPDFKVLTRHTDDDLRASLRTIENAPAPEEPAPKARAPRATKVSTENLSDDDLDDLDIDNI